MRFASPGFFPALGIPLRAGRLVEETDTLAAPRVAVVSESFVKQNFPGENPLGRRFRFASDDRTIVGVVGDLRVRGLERESEPQVYLPYGQQDDGNFIWFVPKHLVVRSTVAPATLLPALREIIAKADAQIPVSDVSTLSDIVAGDTAPRRFQARALLAFAAAALLLAGIGIHGCSDPPKSYGARSPLHGIGTRQPSRPGSPVRNQDGSCRYSGSTSTCSRPSSSPW